MPSAPLTGSGERSPVFEDLAAGTGLSPLIRGPLTTAHLMRWSAAMENWHRVHYDQRFATEHDGLPGLLVSGSWKQHFLVQMVRRWLGPDGWLVEIGFEFRKMNLVGDTLTAWGRVRTVEVRNGLGLVTCEIGIRDQDGGESTPGTAVGALPLRGCAQPVPYPFPEEW
jgi:acyl dehydratase